MDDFVSKLYNLESVKHLFANISISFGPVQPTSDVIIEKNQEP